MSDQFVLVMWSTSFFLVENYQEEIRSADFTSKVLQVRVFKPRELISVDLHGCCRFITLHFVRTYL